MKNILYIGPYRENNGLGRSSRRWLNCLLSDKSNKICARPIYLTQNTDFHTEDIPDFSNSESCSCSSYDYIIQHGNPDMFVYDKRFGKNIGIVEIETSNIGHSGWIEKINMLDEIVVGSSLVKESLNRDGVRIPIKVIPEPYGLYDYENKSNFFGQNQAYQDTYIFYTIGQYFEKKNIPAIVLAFALEFDETEAVRLFVKTGDYYTDNKNLENIIKHEINNIHKAAKRYPIKDNKIDILCGLLTNNDIYRLHNSSNCYVNAVRSDANGACIIEAQKLNNTVINTAGIGSCDYLNHAKGLLVESVDTNVYSRDFYSHKTFTIHEQWKEPNVHSIRSCMRTAYENRNNNIIISLDDDIFSYHYTLTHLL